MGQRASFALRWVAILELVQVVKTLLVGWMRDDVLNQLKSGVGDHEAAFAKLHLYSQISFWTHAGIVVLMLVGVVALAASLTAGRAFALAGIALLVVHGVLLVVETTVTIPDVVPVWMKGTWWLEGVTLGVAWMLPLVAAARARPSAFARLGVMGAIGIVVVDAALSIYGITAEKYPPAMIWIDRAVAVAAAAWFASFAFPLAKRLAREASPEAPQAAGRIDGTPLRTLAWMLLLRIGLGVALAVIVMVSVANGEYESAGSLTVVSTSVGGLVSVVIVVALIQYLRFPETHRSEALLVTLGFVVLGVVLDVVSANAASQLFHAVGEAKRATSFWGMPNLSKMEQLQSTTTWAGRGGLALGIGAGLALAASLTKTARALGDQEQIARAKRVTSLLIVAGVGALVVSLALQALARDAAPLLLILGLGLLVVAVALLANWIRLLFGLAAGLERGAEAEPAQSR